MVRPLLLDLFCGAGGAAMGYFLAGFEIIGIDINPQPEYPFRFIQADVLTARIPWHKIDAVHASPPCQIHSVTASMSAGRSTRQHVNLIPETRRMLVRSGKPYIIENVPGAPLIDPVLLCGSMFNLHTHNYELKRHRLFESNMEFIQPDCQCGNKRAVSTKYAHGSYRKSAVSVLGHGGLYRKVGEYGKQGRRESTPPRGLCVQLMGMPWVTRYDALAQAIPPAYTAWLGYWLRKQM